MASDVQNRFVPSRSERPLSTRTMGSFGVVSRACAISVSSWRSTRANLARSPPFSVSGRGSDKHGKRPRGMIEAETVRRLLEPGSGLLSLYMAIEPGERDLRAYEAKLRGMLQTAESALERNGVDASEREALLAPLHEFGSGVAFAEHRDPGLAIFARAGAPPHIEPFAARAARGRVRRTGIPYQATAAGDRGAASVLSFAAEPGRRSAAVSRSILLVRNYAPDPAAG